VGSDLRLASILRALWANPKLAGRNHVVLAGVSICLSPTETNSLAVQDSTRFRRTVVKATLTTLMGEEGQGF
jgi:hypothetical protein